MSDRYVLGLAWLMKTGDSIAMSERAVKAESVPLIAGVGLGLWLAGVLNWLMSDD